MLEGENISSLYHVLALIDCIKWIAINWPFPLSASFFWIDLEIARALSFSLSVAFGCVSSFDIWECQGRVPHDKNYWLKTSSTSLLAYTFSICWVRNLDGYGRSLTSSNNRFLASIVLTNFSLDHPRIQYQMGLHY